MKSIVFLIAALAIASPAAAQTIGPSPSGGSTSFGNPSATIGTSAVNGSAPTAMRSDAAPAIDTNQVQAAMLPIYISGHWYSIHYGFAMVAGSALTANSIRCIPFVIYRPVTISALGIRITTLSAGGNVQIAVYATSLTTGLPTGNVLGASSSLSTNGTNNQQSAPVGGAFSLTPGVYFSCVNADNSTVVLQTTTAAALTTALMGSSTQNNESSGAGTTAIVYTTAQTFGTWPDVTAASWSEVTGSATSGSLQIKVQ